MQSQAWSVHPWVAEAQRRVRFGVDLGPIAGGASIVEWAQMVEELGFDSFWLRDHPARAGEDPFTHLAAVAATTTRIWLGTLVACVQFRHPMLLARVAADVDRLSGGRLVLGLGGGWDAREFAQMRLPLPSPAERLDALEETIQVLVGVWGAGGTAPFTFEGKHCRVLEAKVHPGPVQRPHVPLLIGGGGEQRTLRLVAQYADASNIEGHGATGAWTPEDLRRKYDVLRRRCAALDRPYESVLRSHFRYPLVLADSATQAQAKAGRLSESIQTSPGRFVGTPREAIAEFRAYVAVGVRYFILIVDDAETARLLAERVVPELQGN